MKVDELKGKKVYLLGYGVEGKATEAFLKAKIPDIEIAIGDKDHDPNYLEDQKKYDIAIRSPGISKHKVAIPYTTATNIFFAEVKGTTIGVTGTKGKSTTTSLIYHILKEAGKKVRIAGNIGKPMLEQLLENNDEDTIWVVELSSYMLDDIQYSPHIAIIVSLFSDHADYHGSVEKYHEAKRNIVKFAKPEDIFVYNPKFPQLLEWARCVECNALPYEEFPINEQVTLLKGEHNKDNIRAAVTVTRQFGVDDETVYAALKTFLPLPHRLEMVGTYKSITFYDDAISTTPESTIEALESISDVGMILLGGLDRGYDFSPLIDVIIKKGITRFVFFPDSGKTILKMLEQMQYPFESIETKSMKEAVHFAYANTPKNMVCLLSTASPSYSVWKNFEEKGNEFQQWVKEYGKEDSAEETIDLPGQAR